MRVRREARHHVFLVELREEFLLLAQLLLVESRSACVRSAARLALDAHQLAELLVDFVLPERRRLPQLLVGSLQRAI